MENTKFRLYKKNLNRYYLRVFYQGLRKLNRLCESRILSALVILFSIGVISALLSIFQSGITNETILIITAIMNMVIAVFLVGAGIFKLGWNPHAKEFMDDLLRIGMVNHAGEVPLPIEYSTTDTANGAKSRNAQSVTFFCKGFPVEDWESTWQQKVETALNCSVDRFEEGNDKREVRMWFLPGNIKLPDCIKWEYKLLPKEDFQLAIGESLMGPVTINLEKTPHWLVGAATGGGKSQLLKLLALESAMKDARVSIVDFKGVDYHDIDNCCRLIYDEQQLLTLLDEKIQLMNERKELFCEAGCTNLREYNEDEKTTEKLFRHVIIIDEASLIFDTKGRSKEEKENIAKILNKTNTLTRLGRFAGLHLIIATQRPDVDSIPGSLKANLDGRICGKMADITSSAVVLDNGNAANLPAVPGRFIVRDATGENRICQAYYYNH